MRDGEDWLSRTIQTVDAVMQQNCFVQGVSPKVERSVNDPVAQKRFRLEAVLRVLALPVQISLVPRARTIRIPASAWIESGSYLKLRRL